ncbi:hypothetical protein SteCoe_23421 [Stentor coeruleus]|uniref:Uncharacterized protein n=1 Tax=Stentor coeruleus TaxID=5963 RepID=A0A1R2BJX3_9CILI|nr:hypothetical protein SteCoe_23421 [Stentor coeruleus]
MSKVFLLCMKCFKKDEEPEEIKSQKEEKNLCDIEIKPNNEELKQQKENQASKEFKRHKFHKNRSATSIKNQGNHIESAPVGLCTFRTDDIRTSISGSK